MWFCNTVTASYTATTNPIHITTKCTSLGIQLDIPLSRLQQLERISKNKKPVTDCFEEMCQEWLKDNEKKWTEVYKALEQGKLTLYPIPYRLYISFRSAINPVDTSIRRLTYI